MVHQQEQMTSMTLAATPVTTVLLVLGLGVGGAPTVVSIAPGRTHPGQCTVAVVLLRSLGEVYYQ